MRLGQDLAKFASAFAHRRQDVVRGAVQDAVDAFEPVPGETLAQRFDDWDPAGDRGLEGQRQALFLGASGERRPVLSDQRLVRGDDVLAMIERGLDHPPGNPVGPADQFDDDLDFGIGGHRRRVLVPAHGGQLDAPVAAPVAGRNGGAR